MFSHEAHIVRAAVGRCRPDTGDVVIAAVVFIVPKGRRPILLRPTTT